MHFNADSILWQIQKGNYNWSNIYIWSDFDLYIKMCIHLTFNHQLKNVNCVVQSIQLILKWYLLSTENYYNNYLLYWL